MLVLGYLSTVIELHLKDLGIRGSLVGLVYSVCLFVYFVASVFESTLLACFSGRALTTFGILLTTLGFLLVGPVIKGVFNDIYLVTIGLGMLGLGGALMYSNFYIVPTTSNIIANAVCLYKIEYSDSLIDKIAVCTNFICNIGEIFGPILAGVLTEYLGFRLGFITVALITFGFFIVYYFSMIYHSKDIKADYLEDKLLDKSESLYS